MSRLIKIADWTGEKRGNVVFVHGLGGHPYDTWRRRADDGTFWPLWLAQDIKGLAVYSLGYQSPPSNWIGTAMPLLDEAAHALRVLANSEDLKTGPIAFICHSLGGLIVKQVLRAANEQRSDPHLADFLLRTRQVVFIATSPSPSPGGATTWFMLKRGASYRSSRPSPQPWGSCAAIRLNRSGSIGRGSKPFQSLSASQRSVLWHSGYGRGCRS
jgi:pimeloyl-ACP methyl ester carboxylesterase